MTDTLHEITIFEINQSATRLYDGIDNVQFAFAYEISQDLQIRNRKVYGLLDLLGDVGGLAASLKTLFILLVAILQFK